MGKRIMAVPVDMVSHSRVNKVRLLSPSIIETGPLVKRVAGSDRGANI
jgi:hypothetical protein